MWRAQRSGSKANPEERFYLNLARELGMTRDEMLARISSVELTDWIALYRMEAKEMEEMRQRAGR